MKKYHILFLNGEKLEIQGKNLLEALLIEGYTLRILNTIKQVKEV